MIEDDGRIAGRKEKKSEGGEEGRSYLERNPTMRRTRNTVRGFHHVDLVVDRRLVPPLVVILPPLLVVVCAAIIDGIIRRPAPPAEMRVPPDHLQPRRVLRAVFELHPESRGTAPILPPPRRVAVAVGGAERRHGAFRDSDGDEEEQERQEEGGGERGGAEGGPPEMAEGRRERRRPMHHS